MRMNGLAIQQRSQHITDLLKNFSSRGKFKEGVDYYLSLLDPEPIHHYYGGAFLLIENRFEEAEIVLNAALDKRYFDVVPYLASLYRRTEQFEKAAAILEALSGCVLSLHARQVCVIEYNSLLMQAGMYSTAALKYRELWLEPASKAFGRDVLALPFSECLSFLGQDQEALAVISSLRPHIDLIN
jgi:tetratricopeptide (TPR) repeat protein